jgi:hypothetical protein
MNNVQAILSENDIFDTATEYDAVIATLGFETRARFVSSALTFRPEYLFACGFDERNILAFEDNRQWFVENGFEVATCDDSQFKDYCLSVLAKLSQTNKDSFRFCIDVSSMSRFRLAIWFEVLLDSANNVTHFVDFLYSPAEFSEPIIQDSQMAVAEPVTHMFAGWSRMPELPPSVLIGLGYEQDKAIGIIEYIEPTKVFAFRPRGGDKRYESAVDEANTTFWDIVSPDDVIDYSIDNLSDCIAAMESLIVGSLHTERPVLIPFGPKIFAVCCLLVSCIHYPNVAVWRVSSGQSEEAIDSLPDGKIVRLPIKFFPQSTVI